jgi:sialate O-acetylesterase
MKRLIFLFLILPFISFAETSLPRFFSNGMVLQQSTEVSVWGTDKPGTIVRIVASWSKAGQAKTDQSGRWRLKIATPTAGGPYKLSVSGSSTQNINDIMIGEVWFCSGQSNMEMPLKGRVSQPVEGSNEFILNADNKNIRVFSISKNSSKTLLDNVEGKWISASAEVAGNFSAVAYLYGKKLNQLLKVPVGLIVSSWGGSAIESWMDPQSLSAYPDLNNHKSVDEKFPNRTANLLFNAMVNPVAGYGIKGALWYQGENNVSDGVSYKDYLSSMIKSWRTVWNLGDFPFYFVQIAPFDYKAIESGYLRDSQLRVMKECPNTGMAVTLDLGICKLIHPPKKKEVADRLAYWALAKTYGIKGLEYSGPVYNSIAGIDSNKMTLKFDHSENGIYLTRSTLSGFEIAGPDKVFYPAKAVVKKGTQLTVWCDQVKSPVAVRYGFSNCAEATLYNTAELPASTFRTDSW